MSINQKQDIPCQTGEPFVSVIVPAWNGARTLGAAMDSVLGQTYRNLELIVCDDASEDDTGTLLASYSDSRIRVIRNPDNIGAGPSRDRAIDVAKGDWLAFIDADDIWQPERLERLLDASGNRTDVIIFDNIIECHDGPDGLVPWKTVRGPSAFGGDGTHPVMVSLEDFIRQKRLIMQPLFPANAVKQNGLRHSSLEFAEDTAYVLRLINTGLQLFYVPEPMYWYRITRSSLTANRERSKIMAEVLDQAMHWLQLNDRETMAFKEKIRAIKRDAEYESFLWALKDGRWPAAFGLACRRPVIFIEFFRRLMHTLPYRLHGALHGARGR